MVRGAAFLLAGLVIAASDVRAQNCFTTQSTGASVTAPSPEAAIQFRLARRIELFDWARSEKRVSASEALKVDALRAQVEDFKKAKRWGDAESAINQAMKLLGVVNRAEVAKPGC